MKRIGEVCLVMVVDMSATNTDDYSFYVLVVLVVVG